ncbi:MAG: V-type ATP synthase subunit F [Christensenellales bacterium]
MADKALLGAVGEKDAVLAFQAIGVRALPAATVQEVNAAIHLLARDGVRVIFITESAARLAPEMIARFAGNGQVSIIPVPGTGGTDGYGQQQVHLNVIKAIGSDILADNDRKED